jgi:hypothetical protein
MLFNADGQLPNAAFWLGEAGFQGPSPTPIGLFKYPLNQGWSTQI